MQVSLYTFYMASGTAALTRATKSPIAHFCPRTRTPVTRLVGKRRTHIAAKTTQTMLSVLVAVARIFWSRSSDVTILK